MPTPKRRRMFTFETLEAKKDKYDEEVDAAEETLSDLLNRAMNLTFNGMDDRAALYKRRQRAKQQHYKNKKQKLRQVGGFGVPYAYAQQELADAADHLATGMGLFPLGAEANELVGLVFLQANDGNSAMRSFDAVASQNLPVSFYAELRGHKKDHAVKCELNSETIAADLSVVVRQTWAAHSSRQECGGRWFGRSRSGSKVVQEDRFRFDDYYPGRNQKGRNQEWTAHA